MVVLPERAAAAPLLQVLPDTDASVPPANAVVVSAGAKSVQPEAGVVMTGLVPPTGPLLSDSLMRSSVKLVQAEAAAGAAIEQFNRLVGEPTLAQLVV